MTNAFKLSIVVASLTFMIPRVAMSGLLEDFQKAESNKGCASIPYEQLQQNCINKRSEVERYCKDGAFSCDGLDPRALQANVQQVQEKIESLNRKRSDLSSLRDQLKSKLSSATDDSEKRSLEDQIRRTEYEDDSAKNEIYEYGKKIDDWKRQLSNERDQINDRIYNGKNCITARVDTAKIFGETYSKADSETDPAVVPIAKRLLSYWADEQKAHNHALGLAQTAVEKCGRML